MEPAEEVLSIALFLEMMGFTTKIGGNMELEATGRIIGCMRNVDVFTFKQSNLKGIDPKIVVHVLHEDTSVKLVKQKLWRLGVEKDKIILEEIQKLLEAEHIEKVQFPIWLFNVIMVAKSMGKWRMCTDFRDLNKTCPKVH